MLEPSIDALFDIMDNQLTGGADDAVANGTEDSAAARSGSPAGAISDRTAAPPRAARRAVVKWAAWPPAGL